MNQIVMKKNTFALRIQSTILALPVIWAAVVIFIPRVESATIWDGPTFTYTQPGTDATQPTNQDRLTSHVWLTRNDTHGLFNAALESSYTANFSPEDTEWAYGELTNYASLTYTNWQAWNGSDPPSMVGQDAVVHLISEDIYLSVQFISWSEHGGPFAYVRSTPNVVAPPPPTLTNSVVSGDGSFQLTFTNLPGYTFTVLGATNLSLAVTNWMMLGQVTDAPPGSGSYQFTDAGAKTNQPQRFYRVSWP
jgi:hypothetical protein